MTNSREIMKTTLVVGATGLLGAQIVEMLRASGQTVRALVRTTSDPAKVERLRELGAQVVLGDLKEPASLARACTGITNVISTATATVSHQEGDSIATVDQQGNLTLIDIAVASGVERFVFVSFLAADFEFELQKAKQSVESRLQTCGLQYTILQPVNFMEVWLSPLLGFDPLGGKVLIFGSGERSVHWVSFVDVARVACSAVQGDELVNRTVPIGGPDPLSALQVLAIFEECGAPKAQTTFTPESALEQQFDAAPDALAQAYAAIMLLTARGQAVPAETVPLLPGRKVTVRDHAKRIMAGSKINKES